ncbi:hypothetical protein [Mycolicibacter kumamotonensis]|uniref:hypothetical protein n=1 Tax=Mycolicibacter kumamotonensis TaxID=354243 RepID=UPI0013FE2945|nr:hypothetical protein [Mycolicibacter kumamotonensis]
MPQYKSVAVHSGSWTADVDKAVAEEATRQGKDGWRINNIMKQGERDAIVEFVKD